MEPPIACTLGAGDRQERREEWRTFLSDAIDRAVRVSEVQLRVRLDETASGVVARTVDLSRREKECCAFFEFALRVEVGELWLEICVPSDASSVLDEFASLTPWTAS